MMRIVFIVCAIVLASHVKAQMISFMNVYGNTGYDYGRDIKELPDSGFIVTGSSSSFATSEADAYLMKVNKYGDFLWSYNYGGPDSDWGQSVVVTHDSAFAIGGYTNSSGAGGFDFYLVRTAIDGTPLWEKTYGGADWDFAYDLVEMPDSGFVLVGYSYSFSGTKDGYIVRTDKTGDTLWTKILGGPGEEFINAVMLDGDSIVVCGGTDSYGAGAMDGLICKMGIDGTTGWTKYIGSAYNDYFTSITGFSNYYMMGGSRGYNYPAAGTDMWFYKLSDDGNTELYDTTFINFSGNDDCINDLGIDPTNEDIFYGGQTKSWGYLMDGMPDIFVGKNSSASTAITAKNFGEAGEDAVHALDLCKDYGVVFVGDTKHYSTGGNNIIIIKLTYLWTYPDQFTDLTFNNITTGLEEENSALAFTVYPNPADDVIQFNLPAEQVNNIAVYSMDGKLVCSGLAGENILSVAELNPGMYLLEVKTETTTYTTRIIRN
jgi:hypothetical protein